MERGVFEIGDKVICIYRKDHHQEGRIHEGVGVVTHVGVSDSGPYFYSVKLDIGGNVITLVDTRPFGAIMPYTEKMDKELRIFHDRSLRLILALEDDYFDKFEKRKE